MRNGLAAALLLVAILAGAGAGYFFGASGISGGSKPSTPNQPQTICQITGEAIGVALHVVASNYSDSSTVPVAGAAVTGEGVLYCGGERQVNPFGSVSTNSTGWVDLFHDGGGVYYLNVTYPGSVLSYSLSVPVPPVTATYVTFNISTGNMTTHFCEYDLHCLGGG
jgi:hypothetical protein